MMSQNQPPKIAKWLVRFFCPKEYRDEIFGDLQEIYEWRLATGATWFARYRYFLDAFSAIRFYRGGRFKSYLTQAMFFSFIKSSLRNFRSNLSYTFLNVFGLAMGLAAALFILEFISEELNFNNSSNSDQLYRVSNDYYRFGEMIYESCMTFSGVGPAMNRDIPEVEAFARLYGPGIENDDAVVLTRLDEPSLYYKQQKLFFADPDFPEFFDIEIVQGSNDLDLANTGIISIKAAEKYFGSADGALGRSLRYNDHQFEIEFLVTGVFEKPDFEMQVDVEVLISYATAEKEDSERFSNDWGGNSIISFVKLQEGVDHGKVERMMTDLTLKYKPGYAEKNDRGEYLRVNRYFLTPITQIHLHSEFQNEVGSVGDSETIWLLQVIALFIVAIAWINFINLSTATSINRSREVGMRKVLGASKFQLITQFYIEAILINCLAILLGIMLVFLGQSIFNSFVEKELSLESIDIHRFGLISGIILVSGISISGVYPALVISSHKILVALKGKSKVDPNLFLRRSLIVFQLFFSSLLIIATLAINQQLEFMKNQSLGFSMDKVLILRGPIINGETEEERLSQINYFKDQIRSISGVDHVSTTNVIPGQGILRGMAISRIRQSESDMKSIERVVAGDGFLSTLKVRFIAGQDFQDGMDGYVPLVLNNSAAKTLGFSDPKQAIGQTLYEFTRYERKVVGVIEDYHHESLNRGKDPMYFVRNNALDEFYAIRLQTSNLATTVQKIEDKFTDSFPGNPADHYFLDRFFDQQYNKDKINRKVFTAFAFMAMIVACLGLYGLSSFSALQRTKEVGVRKVFGASIPDLFVLLASEVFMLCVLGFCLAAPVAWLGIDGWLDDFAYRMSMDIYLFVISLLAVVVIAVLATGYQILRVSVANPIQSLGYE